MWFVFALDVPSAQTAQVHDKKFQSEPQMMKLLPTLRHSVIATVIHLPYKRVQLLV